MRTHCETRRGKAKWKEQTHSQNCQMGLWCADDDATNRNWIQDWTIGVVTQRYSRILSLSTWNERTLWMCRIHRRSKDLFISMFRWTIDRAHYITTIELCAWVFAANFDQSEFDSATIEWNQLRILHFHSKRDMSDARTKIFFLLSLTQRQFFIFFAFVCLLWRRKERKICQEISSFIICIPFVCTSKIQFFVVNFISFSTCALFSDLLQCRPCIKNDRPMRTISRIEVENNRRNEHKKQLFLHFASSKQLKRISILTESDCRTSVKAHRN